MTILWNDGFQLTHYNSYDPTHYLGHTLDVVISRDTSDVVCNVKVTDMGLSDDKGNVIHDHFAVVFNIKQVALLLKQDVREAYA